MKGFFHLTIRNIKLFFKDKGMFFASLITPLVLLVLYITFLQSVYAGTFKSSLHGIEVSEKLINAFAGGQLFSAIIAVSCVTVAFCSNILVVQDKTSGARKGFLMSPLRKPTLALSYFAATFFSTLLICLFATMICLIYMAIVGWFLTFADICLIICDTFLLSLFGTVLSSIVNSLLTSQGQVSAVATIVSSMYGFICGAYMPIFTFASWLQKIIMFLPGTYGAGLIKNHITRGLFAELSRQSGITPEVVETIKNISDENLYFFGHKVSIGAMYGVLVGSILLLLGIYILLNLFEKRKTQNKKTQSLSH